MSSFFRQMSFPRAVILFCTLGSLVLGYLVFQRSQRLDEIQRELKLVENVLREIQVDATHLNDLQRVASNEKFKAQSEPETYIRNIAQDDMVNLGQLAVDKTTKPVSGINGVEDRIYRITPAPSVRATAHYQRVYLGNFMFKLETDSRRVKVTSIKLDPVDKRLKPGQISSDEWTFDIELTTRIQEEKPGT